MKSVFEFPYVTELQLHKILQTQTKTSDVNDMTKISRFKHHFISMKRPLKYGTCIQSG